jgi:hypothetical protein
MNLRKLSVIVLIVACIVANRAQDLRAATISREYTIKAVYLLKFATMVDWPDTAFAHSRAPIVIGVLGRDPFGEALEKTFEGKTAGKREVLIKRSYSLSELKDAQVLFICSSEEQDLSRILSSLKGSSVLTVSDTDGFVNEGGIVNFKILENRTRYEINNSAAQKAGLKFSPELLERAVSVK